MITSAGPRAWGLSKRPTAPYHKNSLSRNVTQNLGIGGLL